MKQITLTTMCALINEKNEVLFIERKKDWLGLALLGGHIENNESVIECVKREMFEETGFIVSNLIFKGITHFFNHETEDRYIVFNFISYEFEGKLIEYCPEGRLQWIPKNQFNKYHFAEGMEKRFDSFFNDGITEKYIEWTKEEGYIKTINNKLNDC